ncbi:MAG: aldehyde dehydrogenase [Acholeplasmataceae bacterium]|jgi:aldehyde dehydrogenase (NAD+)|nr:aldehyde dehydrogenase [Acholeplasmataceae bacterium]
MDLEKLIKDMRDYHKTNETLSYSFRIEQLKKLKQAIHTYQDDILEALKKDLNKSHFEGFLTEVGIAILEIKDAMKHLKKWMKVKRVKTPLTLFKAKSYVYPEPYGVVLIMSPWNYPFQLAIAPLIGAIASGNVSVLKLSPDAKHTSEVTKKMIESIFNPEYVSVLTGGLEESQNVIKQRFDYIFFTGSTHVGRIVMQAASKHLTPVTLELGGKSPCIVDDSADLDKATKRIAFGKFVNAGQTCIAPDYIYVQEHIKDAFVEAMKKWIHIFFQEHPIQKADYPRIINNKHYQRLISLMDKDKVIHGGRYDQQKIEPTLLDNITRKDLIMQEEIFGPLLPILTYKDLSEVILDLKQQEKPLALYMFSKNKANLNRVLNSLSFGGATINDTLMHVASGYLPFGGVGESGMGSYHGKKSFDTFSHEKSVLFRSNLIDLDFRYHPYTKRKKKIIDIFMK